MEDFSRLVKYCKLAKLNDELTAAFKKADSYGKFLIFLVIEFT